jgi:hypothetical protein
MIVRRLILPLTVIACLSGASCRGQSVRNYNVDKPSPGGTYRVKVDVRVEEEGDIFGRFTEQGKIQIFKGREVVYKHDWKRTDTWEPTFADANPIVEWVGDTVVRMGQDTSDQPFSDEFVITNTTDEYLSYVEVNYGKYESLRVFDIAPGDETTLHASPMFKPDGSSNYFFSYGGTTRSGKKFTGGGEDKQRQSPAGGQLKFQITTTPKDLKAATKR